MSSIATDQGLVPYETFGSGRPLILPNSGHFLVLDEPNYYLGLIRSFFVQPPSQN